MSIQIRRISTVILSIVSLAIVAAVIVMVAYVARTSYDLAFQLEKQAMDQSTHSLTQTLSRQLREHSNLAKTLAAQNAVMETLENGDPARAAQRLGDYMRSYGDSFWGMLAFDRRGRVLAGFDSGLRSLAGRELGGQNYVGKVLDTGEVYISPDVFRPEGSEALVYVVTAPVRDASGRILGGVAIFPLWERFSATFLDPVRFGERGYGFVIDSRGRIIAHAMDKDLILRDLSSSDFIREALRIKTGDVEYDWQGDDKVMTVAHVPETGWIVCMSAYVEELTHTATHQTYMLALIGLAVISSLVALLAFVMHRSVSRPVQAMEAFTKRITQGDFKASLDGAFKYEFADLSRNVTAMVAELKNKLGFAQGLLDGLTTPCIVSDPKERVLFVNQASLDFLEVPGKPSDFTGSDVSAFFYGESGKQTIIGRAIREKSPVRNVQVELKSRKGRNLFTQIDAAPMYDLDGTLIAGFALFSDLTTIHEQQKLIEEVNKRIAKAATEAGRVSDQVASASEELSAQVEQSSQGASEQQSRTGEAATAMEQMNSSVLEVARNASSVADLADRTKGMAKDGSDVVASVVQVIGRINAKAGELKDDMTKLGQQAQGIGQILGVISDIADQTNLLALNAAIEAARAGEAGRGFAVVADEVRKLAEKTMSATHDVEESIKSIQDSVRKSIANTDSTTEAIRESTELAGRSGQALQGIVAMVEETADQVRGIATASEEQSAASEQINRSIEEINRISTETSDAMNQSAQAVSDLANLAGELKSIIERMQQ